MELEITRIGRSMASKESGCKGGMYIEELKEGGEEFVYGEEKSFVAGGGGGVDSGDIVIASDAKRVLVGAGARALFYPTLLYNVVRNKIQSEFRWWDRVDEFVLLGAVPFPTDVPRLKKLGVSGVVTLNEPYETLVPTALYHAHDIDHLVIPTRDYLFAPLYSDICKAVDFIHENASRGETTYVHCKAGRGRSTTIVLCYLVEHKQMTPDAAYEYVRSIRPRVLLASSQRQAVQDYYFRKVKKPGTDVYAVSCVKKTLGLPSNHACDDFEDDDFEEDFEDGSVVVITEADLDGYDESSHSDVAGNTLIAAADVSLACKVQFASQAAIGRLSCLWLRSSHGQKLLSRKRIGSSARGGTDQLVGNIGVDISVC